MTSRRLRLFRVIALTAVVVLVLIGIVAVVLIQTSWFKDRLRTYAVARANEYLTAEVGIGGLTGSLWSGIELRDVTLRRAGEHVVAVDRVTVDYSLGDLVFKGLLLERLTLHHPVVNLRETREGWNVAGLVRETAAEEDREGPARPVRVGSIRINRGAVSVTRCGAPCGQSIAASPVRLPRALEGIEADMSLSYQPVDLAVGINSLSLRTRDPELVVESLTGRVKVVNDDLQVEGLALRTAQSDVRIDGVIDRYTTEPTVDLALNVGRLTVAEFEALVPALQRVQLSPRLSATAKGRLADMNLQVKATDPAGRVEGNARLRTVDGASVLTTEIALGDLDVGAILRDPTLSSSLTGRVRTSLRAGTWSDPASMTGDVSVEASASQAAGYAIDRARVDARLDRGRATLTLDAAAYGARATSRGTVTLPAGTSPLAFDLNGTLRDLDPRRLPARLGLPRLQADVGGAYHARLRNGRLQADVRLADSSVEGARIAEGATVTFAAGGGPPEYAFTGDVAGLDPARFGRAVGVTALAESRFAGEINGRVDMRGQGASLDALQMRADIALAPSRVAGVSVPGFSASLRLAGRTLDADLAGAFVDLDPATLGAGPRMQGKVQGSLAGKVRIDQLGVAPILEALTFDGGVSVGASSVGSLVIDQASLGGRLAGGLVTVRTFDLTGPAIRGHVTGQVALTGESAAKLTYQFELRDLQALSALAGQDVRGMGTLEGELHGTRTLYATKGIINANSLQYAKSFDVLQLKGGFEAEVPDLRFADARGKVDLALTQPTIASRQLLRADVKLAYDDGNMAFDVDVAEPDRTLGAVGRLVLHAEHREMHVERVAVVANRERWQLESGGEAVIRYGAGIIELENVRFFNGNQRIAAVGVVALDDSRMSSLDVRVERIDLASVGRLLLMPEMNLAGTLDARATLAGTGVRRVGSAEFSVSGGTVRNFTFEDVRGTVALDPTNTRLDINVRQSADASFVVAGTLPSSEIGMGPPVEGAAMDVRVTAANLNLALVEAATEQVMDVAGRVAADLRVVGSLKQPTISGEVAVTNAAFVVAATGADYQGFNARLVFAGDRVDIASFRIADDDGDPLTVTGQLAVNGFKPGAFQATFVGENFEVIDNELGDVDADMNLTIKGELAAPNVTGDVRVRSGRIEVDRLFERLNAPPAAGENASASAESVTGANGVQSGQAEARSDGGSAAPAEAGGLDVKVVLPDNLVVRGTDIRPANTPLSLGDVNVTLGGEFQVRKPTGQDALVVGSIRTVRGTYEFQGRRFDILDDGRVMFHGNRPVNPGLDIAAEREISGILAQVRVGGTAREPQLTVSSQPPLEESEILALIVFNQPLNQLSQGQRVSLAERAGSMAAGFIVTPLAESLGRALDLDIFEVRGFGSDGGGPTLRVGEQIGEKTFVSLEQGFGAQEVTQFMLEYQLSDILRLKGSIAEGSGSRANRALSRRVERSGIDLVLRIRY